MRSLNWYKEEYNMKLHTLTDIGKSRKENQDNYWSALLEVNGVETGVICLCDGMGGLNNGGYASRLVVKAVKDYILSDFVFDGVGSIIKDVNNRIYGMSKGDKNKVMGTTCTLLVCHGGTYNICHIGDSRAYKLSKGKSTQLTVDHSAVKEYGVTKQNNPVLWEKYKNKLTRCIGAKDGIELDYYTGTYSKGDSFFLCSDGCWHYFDDNNLDVDTISDLKSLFNACMAVGERDNLTAGVLCI